MTVAVVALVTGAVLASAAGLASSGSGKPTDIGETAIATVDGEPVYGVEVGQHVRPSAPWIGVKPPADPVDAALRDAVLVRLLAAEARRQGITAPSGPRSAVDAQLNLTLIDREMARRGIRAEAFTSEQARAFFQAHHDRLARFRSARVAAVVVTDRRVAEQLLPEAARASDSEFRELVARHSVDPASRANGGHLAEVGPTPTEVPLAVGRIAVAVRRSGEVGLADTGDGRYWVVRVTDVHLDHAPWNAQAEQRVRQLMVQEGRDALMAELEQRLRPQAKVKIDMKALGRFRAEATGVTTAAGAD
ncbi:MAG TPA: peptidyl-prolyl cis-trans isomerase [Micromonosporaceae bacterium]|nr:peptidyl-prolyl cis-trans isomerase [Micromonosporaceae bacterium]